MNDLLERIAEKARQRSALEMRIEPLAAVKSRLRRAGPVRPFRAALEDGTAPRVIAELKKASPVKGVLREDFHPVDLAKELAAAGAAALSVLTEEEHFQGSPLFLRQVREAVALPLLRKDFVMDEYEVYRSRLMGADAVLLIVALLSEEQLRSLVLAAGEAGIDALVEVHDEAEAKRALGCGARLIGVNNRDLHTFEVDLETSRRLGPVFPDGVTRVSESGLRGREDLRALSAAGYRAFLIGEELMRRPRPGEALREMLS
jgi:indole-3-glycerol phosphate synthase